MKTVKTFNLTTMPPSVNAMYRGGRRFLTKKGKEAKEAIGYEVLAQRDFEPLKGKVAMNVMFFFPDERKRDIDNCLKSLLDCLTGIVFVDDSQIVELHVYKQIDKKNPRTVFQIL